MNNNLIHPQLMENLVGFFPHICDIETATYSADGVGDVSEDLKSWASLEADVQCKISAWNSQREGNEMRRSDSTIVLHPYVVMLQGLYTTISERDRVVSDSINYDILSIDVDSESTMTRLVCERLSP